MYVCVYLSFYISESEPRILKGWLCRDWILKEEIGERIIRTHVHKFHAPKTMSLQERATSIFQYNDNVLSEPTDDDDTISSLRKMRCGCLPFCSKHQKRAPNCNECAHARNAKYKQVWKCNLFHGSAKRHHIFSHHSIYLRCLWTAARH